VWIDVASVKHYLNGINAIKAKQTASNARKPLVGGREPHVCLRARPSAIQASRRACGDLPDLAEYFNHCGLVGAVNVTSCRSVVPRCYIHYLFHQPRDDAAVRETKARSEVLLIVVVEEVSPRKQDEFTRRENIVKEIEQCQRIVRHLG